jgi:hypothetical protein
MLTAAFSLLGLNTTRCILLEIGFWFLFLDQKTVTAGRSIASIQMASLAMRSISLSFSLPSFLVAEFSD